MNLTTITSPLPNAAVRAQSSTGGPTIRFEGDAFDIHQGLRPEVRAKVQADEHALAEALAREEAKKRARFKKMGDRIVWKRGDETLNVAEMLAFLCRIRPDDQYPGFSTLARLEAEFPGLKTRALRKGLDGLYFDKLYQQSVVGRIAYPVPMYWLKPEGARLLSTLYPSIAMPAEGERFVSPSLFGYGA